MYKLKDILAELVEGNIRQRGYLYFIKGLVENLKFDAKKATADVYGSSVYKVEIKFNKDRYPLDCWCTCPYNEVAVCKHVVAVLYKLNSYNFFTFRNIIPFNGYSLTYNDFEDDIFNRLKPYSLDNNKTVNQIIKKSINEPNTRQQWLQEVTKQNEEAKFSRFKNKFTGFVEKNEKKITSVDYKIAYAVNINEYGSSIYVLRQRIKKNGTLSVPEIVHGTNLKNLPVDSFKEKLIIEYLSKAYGEFSVELYRDNYFISNSHLKEHLNNAYIFSEILNFLTDKEVYLYEGYRNIDKRVFIQKEGGHAEVLIDDNGNGELSLKLRFYFNNEQIKSETKIIPVLDSPLWVMAENKVFKISNLTLEQFANFAENPDGILIPKIYLEYFEEALLPELARNLPLSSEKYQIDEVSVLPVNRIYLEEEEDKLKIILKYFYSGFEVGYNESEKVTSFFKEGKITKIIREKNLEESARQEIKNFYVKEIEKGIFIVRKNPVDFLFESLPYFKEKGFEIFGASDLTNFKVNTSKPIFSFNVSSGIDWFDVSSDINFNGVPISFDSLINALKHKKEYVRLEDGSIGFLPKQWVNKFNRALVFGSVYKDQTDGNGGLRFSRLQANAVDLLIQDAEADADSEFKEHIEKLNSFENIHPQKIPNNFKKVLRPYQKGGYDWLYFLKEFNFGGILADDMGLGKTIQVLALLSNENKNNGNIPSLVIAPTSVVFNWINEAEKFSPELKILNHTGKERIREDSLHFENYSVILTSYSIVLRDIEILESKEFNYLILDESQKIKNPNSKTARLIKTIKAEHRLCLTGTPVENNLTELWSQMTFLNPGMLGPLKKFQEAFVKPIQKSEDDSASEYLRKTVYPFILRRTKEVVAKELPPKSEVIHYCEMEPGQEKIYNVWRDSVREEIIKEIETKGIKKSGFKVLEGLLRLRQICNHPSLVKESYKNKSGKFEEFKELLEGVIEENHKVLVFSQFVKMLEIIKAYLDKKEITYEYLTGSTINREACVNNFQTNDDVKIFLISLKAGGFGLNLTAADYVFHYDPWWNPAVEMQATDRTHRIGQDKNIFVYKFITKNSVEEKILQLQNKKKKLVENIITSENGILKNLTKEDIDVLFG